MKFNYVRASDIYITKVWFIIGVNDYHPDRFSFVVKLFNFAIEMVWEKER